MSPSPTTQQQLDTQKANLDRLEVQRANYGLNPPLALVNEIEFAQREIERLEGVADAEALPEMEQAYRSLVEASNPLRQLFVMVWRHEKRIARWERKPSARATAIRWLTLAVLGALYTTMVIKEFRDAILTNWAAAAVIVVLLLALVALLRVLAVLLETNDGEHDN